MYNLIEKLTLSSVNTLASDRCMDYYYHKVATAINLQEGRKKGEGGERLTERGREREKAKGYGQIKHRWREGELEPQVGYFFFVSTFESHIIMPS